MHRCCSKDNLNSFIKAFLFTVAIAKHGQEEKTYSKEYPLRQTKPIPCIKGVSSRWYYFKLY